MIIAIFVLNFFDQMFVTPEELLKGAKGSNNIFSGKLSLVLLFLTMVMIAERYISRADVRVRVQKKGLNLDDESFFQKEKVFARSNTNRSMTVKLKTMKTTDLDMAGEESQ